MRPTRPWHPFLLAAFPVLFLYTHNTGHFAPHVVLGPLLLVEVLVLAAWGLAGLVLRSRRKGALLASLFALLFLSYGHIQPLFGQAYLRWGRCVLGPDRFTTLLCLLLFSAACAGLWRTRRTLAGLVGWANLIGLILVASSLLQIGYQLLVPNRHACEEAGDPALAAITLTAGQDAPHIFYLILDGYGRDDILAELYDHDNTALLNALEQRGFYVARASAANYCQTTLSLASALSLDYLDALADCMGPESEERGPLRRKIKANRVAHLVKACGYAYAAFATGYFSTEARNADLFLAPRLSLDEFQNTLLQTTPIPALGMLLGGLTAADLHRERIEYVFDHLPDLSRRTTPTFVLAHIVAPHPPFVFGPGGEPRSPGARCSMADGSDLVGVGDFTTQKYRARYRDQLTYLNTRLITALDGLLAAAQRPVVIILQGDHGPGSGLVWEDGQATNQKERLGILNAYRFPRKDYANLSPTISPVNSFRVLLNQYFGTELERLPDRSFFSTEQAPYAFTDVTARVMR